MNPDSAIQAMLIDLIEDAVIDGTENNLLNTLLMDARVETFSEAGVMTLNKGVQITCGNGQVIQITIASH